MAQTEQVRDFWDNSGVHTEISVRNHFSFQLHRKATQIAF